MSGWGHRGQLLATLGHVWDILGSLGITLGSRCVVLGGMWAAGVLELPHYHDSTDFS